MTHEDATSRERRVERWQEGFFGIGWPLGSSPSVKQMCDVGMALADSEQAVLVAKVAELEQQVRYYRDIEAPGWEARADAVRLTRGYFGEQAAENGLRADAAEATLAKVAALADDWQGRWASPRWIDELRAALASAGRPATSDGKDAT